MTNRPWFTFPIALLLQALSGVLLALALPPRDLGALAWVALLPLLIATRIERPLVVFLGGLIAGLVCGWICGGHWNEPFQYGNLVAAFGSLGIVLAFVSALASFASKRMSANLWPVFVGCAAVTGELLGAQLFPVSLAITQYRNSAALHLASVTGIWGVGFMLWLAPAGIAVLYPKVKSAVPALAIVVLVMIGAWLMPLGGNGSRVSVAAIQAPDSMEAADQTERIRGRAEFVVWPELLLGAKSDAPASSARAANVYLAASVSKPNGKGKPSNAARLFSPAGQLMGTFEKQRLFGRERFSFASGNPSDPVMANGVSVAVPICYDTVFTGVVRDYVRRGARLILVPNHDPDMPNSVFNYLHSAVIPFRAAENGVPIVWAECQSLSMIVDSDGRILARGPEKAPAFITASVHLRSGLTFFTRAGDYFAYLCVTGCVLGSILSTRSRSRKP